MVRINKHELSPNELEGLFKQLSTLLSHSSDRNVHLLLEQLLGPEEKIMLAKRLAVIVMLNQKRSYNQIADTLHISPTTAGNISARLSKKQVKKIMAVLKKDDTSYVGILDILGSILSVGGIMPSRTGLDRYR